MVVACRLDDGLIGVLVLHDQRFIDDALRARRFGDLFQASPGSRLPMRAAYVSGVSRSISASVVSTWKGSTTCMAVNRAPQAFAKATHCPSAAREALAIGRK